MPCVSQFSAIKYVLQSENDTSFVVFGKKSLYCITETAESQNRTGGEGQITNNKADLSLNQKLSKGLFLKGMTTYCENFFCTKTVDSIVVSNLETEITLKLSICSVISL